MFCTWLFQYDDFLKNVSKLHLMNFHIKKTSSFIRPDKTCFIREYIWSLGSQISMDLNTWCRNSLEALNKLKLSVSFQYFHCLQSLDWLIDPKVTQRTLHNLLLVILYILFLLFVTINILVQFLNLQLL